MGSAEMKVDDPQTCAPQHSASSASQLKQVHPPSSLHIGRAGELSIIAKAVGDNDGQRIVRSFRLDKLLRVGMSPAKDNILSFYFPSANVEGQQQVDSSPAFVARFGS